LPLRRPRSGARRRQRCAFSRTLKHEERKGQGRLPPVWKGGQCIFGQWQKHGRCGLAYVIDDADMFPPPGLLDVSNPVQYTETASGGDGDWLSFTSTKLYTNAFIVLPGPPRKVTSEMKPVANCFLHTLSLADSPWLQETWIWCRSVS